MGRDGYTGLVVLAASLFLFWATLGLERHPLVPVGPGFYPRIVLAVTVVLAVFLIVVDVVAHRKGGARPAAKARYGAVLAAFGVFAAYVVLLPYLGFRAATFAFLVAAQAQLEWPASARRWALVITVALVATAVCYYVFDGYLQVLLPRGRWTGF